MSRLYKNNSVSLDASLNIIPIRRFPPKVSEPACGEAEPAFSATSYSDPAVLSRRDVLNDELALLEQKVQESERQAARIIEMAMEEARLIEKTAYEAIGARIEKAVKQGYADGYNLGAEEGKLKCEEVIKKLRQFSEFLLARQDEMLAQFEDELYALVFDITRKIIHKEISNDDYAFPRSLTTPSPICAAANGSP